MDSTAIFVTIITILGAVTLFLYGMKLMSESLQHFSGNRLRKIFSRITSNRFKAVAAGTIVTGIIQSSSATTVMLVSFVNAGLLSLKQALGIMMGANIGTTVTAWLITLFGFRFEFSSILLPVLGLSLPLLFLSGIRNRAAGEFILGFAILFLGLQFMKNSLPDISENSSFVTFFRLISDQVALKYLIFALGGMIITMIIQSSSATMALTIVMCSKGYITYEAAAAMVLGENLGTTITANLAAIMANRAAKRLALGHALFNFFGLLWAFVFFSQLTFLSSGAASIIASEFSIPEKAIHPLGLSILHTAFNTINTLILIGLIPGFKTLLEKIIPLKATESSNYRLRYFKSGLMAVSDVDILQAQEEIINFGKLVSRMFRLIPEYLMEKGEDKYEKLKLNIHNFEDQSDQLDKEITTYLTHISENDLSESNSRKVTAMFKISSDIEKIADECMRMERTIRRKNEVKAWFSQEMRQELFALFDLVNKALELMNNNLALVNTKKTFNDLSETENKIHDLYTNLLIANKNRIESNEYNYQQIVYYSELLDYCEKLTGHVMSINQSLNGMESEK